MNLTCAGNEMKRLKMTYRLFTFLAAAAMLTACEKDELPVEPFPRGAAEIGSLFMGAFYSDQVWYSLGSNSEVTRNKITDWDIALEGAPNGWKIYLNGARMMTGWLSPHNHINTATDTAGFGSAKRAEIAAEFFDAPALPDWHDHPGAVYLLDLGFSELGVAMGLVWMQVVSADENQYEIRTRLFAESEVRTHEIPKNPGHHLVHFSILQGSTVSAAPPDDAWDVVFTKYTYQFVDPPLAYLVTGALLNPHNTRAVVISDKAFEAITAADTLQYPLINQPDIIGYDWKTYSFDLGQFTVNSKRTYLIQVQSGFLYKIRFVDFYNASGAAGAPMFEKVVV